MEKKWKFCFVNGGWWVVIDNIDKLVEFKAKINPKKGNLYERAAIMAQEKQISLCAAVAVLGLKTYGAEWDIMCRGNTIWHCGGHYYDGFKDDEIEEIVYSDELIFPDEVKSSSLELQLR